MIVNKLTNFLISASVPGICLILLLIRIIRKKTLKAAIPHFIAICVSVLIVIFLNLFAVTEIIDIRSKKEGISLLVYGKADYKFMDGRTIQVKKESGKRCIIINSSDEDLILEEIIYTGIFEEDEEPWPPFHIKPHSELKYEFRPHYLPYQRPPMYFENKRSGKYKNWLHFETDQY